MHHPVKGYLFSRSTLHRCGGRLQAGWLTECLLANWLDRVWIDETTQRRGKGRHSGQEGRAFQAREVDTFRERGHVLQTIRCYEQWGERYHHMHSSKKPYICEKRLCSSSWHQTKRKDIYAIRERVGLARRWTNRGILWVLLAGYLATNQSPPTPPSTLTQDHVDEIGGKYL